MDRVEIAAPGGAVTLTLLPNAERLTFTLTRGDTVVLDASPIVMIVDGYDLSSGVALGTIERYEIDETYPWHGAHAVARNRCRGARVSLQHDLSFVNYVLDVRVFDDAVAFRHIIPGDPEIERVPDEYTTFVVPAGSTVWYHDLGGHYESAYEERNIAEIAPGQWAGPPVTFRLPGEAGYAAIAEANLVGYSGMALQADGRRGLVTGLGHRQPLNYPFELRYGRDEARRLGKPAAVRGTIMTPWRVVMVAPNLNALVNADTLPSLCPPPDPAYFPEGVDTDWVRPGRAVWRYVDGGDGSFEGLKGFSQMAGELGFEYHIIEGVWSRWRDDQIREIAESSRGRGVRLLFWVHSNQLRTPEVQDAFFARLRGFGIAGAKIDFFDHEAKESIDLYEALLEQAARHQLVLDFHGANKPTGRQRTWPNELVREAVRGMESSSLRERARHDTILPFTRYLAGPADYTVMHFGARRADTTWAHQIASLVVLASPLLTVAAHPQSVLENPAVDLIRSIPPVWDETVVLEPSSIGELALFARRSGTTWFLAAMGGPGPMTVALPLAFLDEGAYEAALARDAEESDAAVRLERLVVRRDDTLTLEMRRGGGFVGRFTRQP